LTTLIRSGIAEAKPYIDDAVCAIACGLNL
jgi:hypothetical protein